MLAASFIFRSSVSLFRLDIMHDSAFALSEIKRVNREAAFGEPIIQTAVASRTDEPEWADNCLKWLVAHDGSSLKSCFDHVEIGFSDKTKHFENLHRRTGISYENMVFFDNEKWNIRSVSRLGVKCLYTPNGMTRDAWKKAFDLFAHGSNDGT